MGVLAETQASALDREKYIFCTSDLRRERLVYPLFTIHYSLFTIHYSLFTIHYPLSTIPYPLQLTLPFQHRTLSGTIVGCIAGYHPSGIDRDLPVLFFGITLGDLIDFLRP